MKKRIHDFLTINPGMKMLALVLAIALWMMVYNSEDPTKTTTFTVNVSVINSDAVTDLNKVYTVDNSTASVTFAVSAKRSYLEKLDSTDFSAVADMENIVVSEDGNSGMVPIEITAKSYSSVVKLSNKTKYLQVSLENLASKQFIVSATSVGTVADGYALGSVTVTNPNVLKVSGPESVIGSISSVVATIDVDEMSQDISDNVIPVLYDASGNEISADRLTFSNTTVTILAKILNVKEVPLNFSTSGTPAGSNKVLNVEADPDLVTIKGTAAVLNTISGITVPNNVLDVTGATGDIVTKIDISEYLPDGTELVDPTQAQVTVTVHIETYSSLSYNIPTASLKVTGLGEGYGVSYEYDYVTVSISASDADLAKLKESDISGSIDLSGLSAGTHYASVDFDLDPDHYTYGDVHTIVYLTDGNAGDSSR